MWLYKCICYLLLCVIQWTPSQKTSLKQMWQYAYIIYVPCRAGIINNTYFWYEVRFNSTAVYKNFVESCLQDFVIINSLSCTCIYMYNNYFHLPKQYWHVHCVFRLKKSCRRDMEGLSSRPMWWWPACWCKKGQTCTLRTRWDRVHCRGVPQTWLPWWKHLHKNMGQFVVYWPAITTPIILLKGAIAQVPDTHSVKRNYLNTSS